MKRLVFGVLLFVPAVHAFDDVPDISEIMMYSKVSGSCGVFGQLARFQTTTKMEGGDEFVARFVSTEMARMGVDIAEWTATCNNATSQYEYWLELFERTKSETNPDSP